MHRASFCHTNIDNININFLRDANQRQSKANIHLKHLFGVSKMAQWLKVLSTNSEI